MRPARVVLLSSCAILCLRADTTLAVAYKATLLDLPSGNYGSVANDVLGNIQVGYTTTTTTGNFQTDQRATLWNGASVVNLHPAGFISSGVNGVSGNIQVGYANSANNFLHALMWTGTADSAVEFTPTLYYDSVARGIYGDSVVGEGRNADRAIHALLWHGTDSVIDLHPSGFTYSYAQALSETKQYGFGRQASFLGFHALLWRGSSASYSDLHPAGFAASEILAGTESTQIGNAYLSADLGGEHAFLWHDTASSGIDLNPIGLVQSSATDVFGDNQVGWGAGTFGKTSGTHALLWHGSPTDFVDLHQYLDGFPVGLGLTSSKALGIDANGNIVGYAYGVDFVPRAILWTPVPEPDSALTLFFALFVACRMRKKRERLKESERT